MSQEKLGEHLNLTFQQIQKYEKGVNRIGAGRLYRMATVLGVDVSFFFEGLSQELMETVPSGLSEPDGTPYLMGFLATPEGLQLNSAFAQITSADQRKRILDLVKTLAGAETTQNP